MIQILPFLFGAAGDAHFTVTFVSGTTPATVALGASYAGPATPAQALFDAGDGSWTAYTSNAITMQGDYLKIRSDWRTAAGTYESLFNASFAGAGYTCAFSGTLDFAATANSAYREIFRNNTSVTGIIDPPFQPITGTPATYMLYQGFYGMSGVTGSLPTGFLDTSGLTGTPASHMFRFACADMARVTGGDIVIGSGVTLTDANIVGPLHGAMKGMTAWTGQMHWGSDVIHTVLTPTSDNDTFQGCVNMPDYATINANWK